MDSDNMQTYCLFCLSGQEGKIIKKLDSAGYSALSPLVMHWKPSCKNAPKGSKNLCKAASRLLPGYVFFEASEEPNWQSISAIPSVIRILHYDDGERALRGTDAAFVTWLKKYNGTIEVTQVIQIGSKISFVNGPLQYMDARVLQVKKSRRQVQIELGGEENFVRTMWCSIEYINSNTTIDDYKKGDMS